jgi:hypothetical protein
MRIRLLVAVLWWLTPRFSVGQREADIEIELHGSTKHMGSTITPLDIEFESKSRSNRRDQEVFVAKAPPPDALYTKPPPKLATNAAGFCSVLTGSSNVPKCRKKLSRCNAKRACCMGFKCSAGKCRRCRKYGHTCNHSAQCCGSICTTCRPECAGKCGVSTERTVNDIQVIYYPWYGNVATDGSYRHWDAKYRVGGGSYDPLHKDLPSAFYPRLGAYSSADIDTIRKHLQWMRRAGIGVLNLSWWGVGSFEDGVVWKILNAADEHGIRVSFYIEPYGDGYRHVDKATNKTIGSRTPYTVKADIQYLTDTYGCHRALYRRGGRLTFMFFAAREYNDGHQEEWRIVWDELHADKKYNPFVIAHDTDITYRIIPGGWDGGHEYGCYGADQRSKNYTKLAAQYKDAGKIFYFTVCPGYDKSRLSGNTDAVIPREHGALYERIWKRAMLAKKRTKTQFPVLVTTFNEWHEGANIEPAKPMTVSPYTFEGRNINEYVYKDYDGAWGYTGVQAQFAYIDKTREFANIYMEL